MSNNLDLTQIAPGQINTSVAVNTKCGEIDAAMTDILELAASDANSVIVTASQLRRHVIFTFVDDTTPPNDTVVVELPAVPRGLLVVQNSLSAESVIVTIDSQPLTPPTVTFGNAALMCSDGINVRAL